jgi:hypothetical protein
VHSHVSCGSDSPPQAETELLNIIWTNSGFTYSRPGEFLFAAQHALIWQSAIHIQFRCCCAQTVAKSLRHNCDPVSAPSFACFSYRKYKQNAIYGLTHVSILAPQFVQTASCISSFVIRVSRIRISAVSQEAVN